MHSCIYAPLTFGSEILEKHLSSIIRIDFLKLLAAEFILNLTFVQLLIRFVSTKNKNLYSLYNISKHQIYTIFRVKARTCSHKKVTNF